jgi:uncharacterized protein
MRGASTRLRVRVSPGAGRSQIVGRHGDGWKVRVAAPPERGRANEALRRLLADAVGVSQADVTLVAGHATRDKVVELEGIAQEETERRLTKATAPGKDVP